MMARAKGILLGEPPLMCVVETGEIVRKNEWIFGCCCSFLCFFLLSFSSRSQFLDEEGHRESRNPVPIEDELQDENDS